MKHPRQKFRKRLIAASTTTRPASSHPTTGSAGPEGAGAQHQEDAAEPLGEEVGLRVVDHDVRLQQAGRLEPPGIDPLEQPAFGQNVPINMTAATNATSQTEFNTNASTSSTMMLAWLNFNAV